MHILRQKLREINLNIKSMEVDLKAANKEKVKIEKKLAVEIKKADRVDSIPASYTSGLKWKQKIYFVLNKLQEGTIDDITKAIIKHEPKLKEQKVYVTIQRTIIRLVDDALIIKIGNYNSTYKLNLTGR